MKRDRHSNVIRTSPPIFFQTKPIIFAIVGKSASGKDYLARMLVKRIPRVNPIVSWTTRPPREKEKEGVDYHFATDKEFYEARRRGEFIEWAKFNNWYYGTPHGSIQEGKVYAGVFNLDGLAALLCHQDKYQIVPIYMETPFAVRLSRSIKREKKFTPEMVRRIFADFNDFFGNRYNSIKSCCVNMGLTFNYRFVEKHPDMIISTVWTYINLLLECEKIGNSE